LLRHETTSDGHKAIYLAAAFEHVSDEYGVVVWIDAEQHKQKTGRKITPIS
jgi:hypothetical protein